MFPLVELTASLSGEIFKDWKPRHKPVEHRFELADGPALRLDDPRSGQSASVGRTVRACAEQFRVPSFVLCLLARFAELARNPVV
jgi:hypothetical protein